MSDGFVFDEYAMDYVPTPAEDLPRCALVKRVAELEQRFRQCIIQAHASNEIDAAQRRIAELEAELEERDAWARLWKRAAQFTRLDRTSYHWWYVKQEWIGMLRFADGQPRCRVAARALGLDEEAK